MEESSMTAKTILIKKYENRRLYDATNSRYVNLEEVAQFVQRGYDVRVIDVASGEDITRVILTQIIAEGAKTPDSSFPLDILRQMVIASGRASQESALRYTKAMLDLYQSTYRAMAPALNPFEFMQNAGGPASPAVGEPPSQPEPRSGRGNGRDLDEVSRLKERVAELEKLVSSLASAGSSRKKAPRKPGNRKK
jgi:polyhydroxyalkanoate synthesis repressor PhaR